MSKLKILDHNSDVPTTAVRTIGPNPNWLTKKTTAKHKKSYSGGLRTIIGSIRSLRPLIPESDWLYQSYFLVTVYFFFLLFLTNLIGCGTVKWPIIRKPKFWFQYFEIFFEIFSKFLNHKMAKGDGLLSGIKNLDYYINYDSSQSHELQIKPSVVTWSCVGVL